MRHILILLFILLFLQADGQDNLPRALTKKDKNNIEAEVERQANQFARNLKINSNWANIDVEKEFIVDTFKIRLRNDLNQDINFTTQGMNLSLQDMTRRYDLLLNKYYNGLMSLLEGEDKKILRNAQRRWLAFRDAEFELIGMTKKEVYSGGGTIQSNFANAEYCNLVESRMIELYQYYSSIYHIKNQG